jgi:hypothetical protein
MNFVACAKVNQVANNNIVNRNFDRLVAVVTKYENFSIVSYRCEGSKLALFGVVISGCDQYNHHNRHNDSKTFDPTGPGAFQNATQYDRNNRSSAKNAKSSVFESIQAEFPKCRLHK